VEALRSTYRNVPDSADYVMYWWYRAAREVAEGRTIRAGLITTNTITQRQNRVVITDAAERGACVTWAVADHPWTDDAEGAAVRVAMTVLAQQPQRAVLVKVNDDAEVTGEIVLPSLNPDLTAHADVAGAAGGPLLANRGISSDGVKLHGKGFILQEEEAKELIALDPKHTEIIHRYRNGRDIAHRPRNAYVIDFGLRTDEEVREYPVLYDLVRDRVRPGRDANARAAYRDYWWRFGEPRREWRAALVGLRRYVATVDTAKYRFFTFVDSGTVSDDKLVCIASDDAFHLGVLSSMIHVMWALAAGGKLGVGNDPVYVKTSCFDPFPFPDPPAELRARIAELAERLDQHRKDAIARDESVTMTGIYNVVTKLRSMDVFTPAERIVHQAAAGRVLREMHQELDRLVAHAYNWRWPMNKQEILERLVELHDVRVEEERAGNVRWLRPDYQIPRLGGAVGATGTELDLGDVEVGEDEAQTTPCPSTVLQQIGALQRLVANSPVTVEQAAGSFSGAKREMVARHLETLALMGELRVSPEGRYQVAA
jgi:hypothetical protein